MRTGMAGFHDPSPFLLWSRHYLPSPSGAAVGQLWHFAGATASSIKRRPPLGSVRDTFVNDAALVLRRYQLKATYRMARNFRGFHGFASDRENFNREILPTMQATPFSCNRCGLLSKRYYRCKLFESLASVCAMAMYLTMNASTSS